MKPLSGYPGYYITRRGKVYSDRKKGGGKTDRHEVKATDKGHQYKRVVLMKDGKKSTRYIHELVADHFRGEKGEEVRHLDGNRLNNEASNLKPGTPKENAADREKHRVRKSETYIWFEGDL